MIREGAIFIVIGVSCLIQWIALGRESYRDLAVWAFGFATAKACSMVGNMFDQVEKRSTGDQR